MLYPPGFIGTLPNPSYAEARIPIASLVPSLVGRVGPPELGLTSRTRPIHFSLRARVGTEPPSSIAICLLAGFIHHG